MSPLHALDRVLVDTVWFVSGMVATLVATIVLAVRYRRAHWLPVRYGLRGAAFVLFVLSGAAWVNAYFAYIPTLGEVLGRRATFQASHAALRRTLASAQRLTVVPEGDTTSREFPIVGPGRREPLSGTVVFAPSASTSAAVLPALPPHGLVELVNIPAPSSGFHARAAQVYLPPAWFDPVRPHLPVIVLLQGTPGTPADWTRGGEADVTVDTWAAAHGGVAPILVMPDPNGGPFADTECVDGKEGAAETYLTQDVRSYVGRTFGAAMDRTSWAIGGLSEGGQCAVTLTMRHPDLFSVFLAFGADDHLSHDGGLTNLFRGSARSAWSQAEAYAPRHLLTQTPPVPVSGWFGAGQADGGLTATAQRMDALARGSGIDSHLGLIPDAHHTFRVWRDAFAQALPWVVARFRTVTYPPRERLLTPAVRWTPLTPTAARRARRDGHKVRLRGEPEPPLTVVPPRVFVTRDDLLRADENPLGRRAI